MLGNYNVVGSHSDLAHYNNWLPLGHCCGYTAVNTLLWIHCYGYTNDWFARCYFKQFIA